MRSFKKFIIENIESVTEFLLYLIHDKSHVIDMKANRKGQKNSNMEFALRKWSKKTKKPVYRGLYLKEDVKIGDSYTFKGYQSFSEISSMATRFATNSKQVLCLEAGVSGFCYYEWFIAFFKKMDDSEFDASDGDFMIESAEEEMEWIFGMDNKFKVSDIYNKGAYTYICLK